MYSCRRQSWAYTKSIVWDSGNSQLALPLYNQALTGLPPGSRQSQREVCKMDVQAYPEPYHSSTTLSFRCSLLLALANTICWEKQRSFPLSSSSLPACHITSPTLCSGMESAKHLYLLQTRQTWGLLIGLLVIQGLGRSGGHLSLSDSFIANNC